ncbi:hypothetical protein PC113_g3757 [Phytophthora cactorum]|uniref:Uncharacterized protein n=2 Tax=Phytophthora cactorum TaxID=29920 RepID=A0A8T1ECE9_9STRA|nr:hypothetical protein PC111_g10400 [Phytophthora cactorum]KAG2865389.1 hypothetical protein PC113_g3757 [Phytophthora cactorum]KAG2951283.1 hypothetical protein PC117_g3691 [Phytophthora cactorum]KAG3059738.1 hypothetical protein PC121_g13815 [Phytophthora cactorum]KAG3205588.1 hypothetical protein PC128_g1344 [Phytophthora cactorum]
MHSAEMSRVEACTCSLQARLHQVENARSREMKAHGELVQKFECELETRRTSEAELRLTVAKMRADKCRLEAEFGAVHAKVRQLLEQLNAQSIEISKREDVLKAFREESDRQLQAAYEKSANLMEEKRHLSFQLSETKTCLENAKHENKLLLTTNEELNLRANTQQEIEAAAARSQLVLDDLTRSRKQQDLMQGRIQELERAINHALVTRSRAIHWRRKRQEMCENRFILHGAFLAWTSTSVQARLQSVAKMTRMTLDVQGGTANGTSGGGSTHPPLFGSPSKRGIHHTVATFIPTEQRFRWQAGAAPSDALYNLPTSIGTSPKKSFGNSTREDWDFARKRADPGAGPGSYEPATSCGKQVSSECRSAGSSAFENAPRTQLQENSTPSPGPIYDLPPVMGRGSSAPKQGTSLRPPLNGKSIGPGPNLMLKGSFQECNQTVSPTFGKEMRLRSANSQQTPGPIYDLYHTDHRTGPRLSFSRAKRF